MDTKDEAVLAVLVVVLGNTKCPTALLVVYSGGLDAVGEPRRLATTGRGSRDIFE